MATQMRPPGGSGVVDVVDENVKTFLAAGWEPVDGKAATAKSKGSAATAVDSRKVPAKNDPKTVWVAFATARGIEIDPKANKPVIIDAVYAALADEEAAGDESPDDAPDDEDTDDAGQSGADE